MSVEKKFVAEGITKALVNEFLAEELERAGYGGMQMNRTPMGTQITVYAEKPGMVIGKGGKLIRKITRDLDRRFRLDNPQIDVQDVGRGDLNGRVVANRLASSLERGWYFRKAGQSMMRRVMDAGALGCEIVISGKLTGPRSRTEKFIAGYIKHSGKPAIELVDRGYSVAVKKLGVIGCQVRIIPPDVRLPDDFQIEAPPSVTEPAPPSAPAPSPAPAPAPVEEKKSELDQLLEPEPEAANVMPEPLEEQPLPQDTAEETSLIEEGDDSAPATRDE
ncbi:30S ribosomal protein S3 [Methanothrix sp.]|uniref:30S ribosomal protein S3 n=1 Tax=Methanothrix sp. TaxID=90426 RepID=UPI003C778471